METCGAEKCNENVSMIKQNSNTEIELYLRFHPFL